MRMENRGFGRGICLTLVCVAAGTSVACNERPESESELVAQQRFAAQTTSSKVPWTHLDMGTGAGGFVNADLSGIDPSVRPTRCDQELVYGTWLLPGLPAPKNQRRFGLPLEGSICEPGHEDALPYLSPNPNYQFPGTTGRSLQLTLPPRLAAPGPDRAELQVNDEGFEGLEGVGFNMNNPKYLGFRVMFVLPSGGLVSPVGGARGDEGIHIMQAKQLPFNYDESHCAVPLSTVIDNACDPAKEACPLDALPNPSHIPLQFHVSTHKNSATPDGPTGGAWATGRNQATGELQSKWLFTPNVWHTFIFYLDPRSAEVSGDGAVKVWFDGVRVIDWVGKWGCNTNPPGQDAWHLRVGMYRTSLGPLDQTLDAFFDDIRVASSRLQADPATPAPLH